MPRKTKKSAEVWGDKSAEDWDKEMRIMGSIIDGLKERREIVLKESMPVEVDITLMADPDPDAEGFMDDLRDL